MVFRPCFIPQFHGGLSWNQLPAFFVQNYEHIHRANRTGFEEGLPVYALCFNDSHDTIVAEIQDTGGDP